MDKTLLDFAMIESVIIGYFVSIALITTPFYKSRANNYLALSLFSIASLTFLEWLTTWIDHIVWRILSNLRLDILFAATLFTYFLVQIKHRYLNERWYKWIYFPFYIAVILEVLIAVSDLSLNLHNLYFDVLVFYIKDFASIGFNVFLIFWGRNLVRNATTISEDKRRWLLRLNLFIIVIILSWILTRIEAYTFNSLYTVYILWVLLCFFLWWILYYGVFKLQVIAQKEEIHKYLVSKRTDNIRTKKTISSATSSKIISQLYMLMEEEELYKDPLLSRLDLANRLDTNEGYLSQIVNKEINKSIIQFVNEYRVEAAKNLLDDPVFDKFSVEAIGMEAGFKSKSAFYNAFKLGLEMSPGAYRKLHKKS